ncbi:MAG: ABC transporter permease [Vallitaleaceae bacterium]|nr:ABC transporter permease [Vallitaleaceae bacterium]
MRTLKHATLSLLRKPTKAIMIFLIMFIVFGLVFTGIIIQNSINESKEYIRITMGGVVDYVMDYNAFYKDEQDGVEVDYMQLRLSETVAQEIAKDSDVIDYYMVGNGGMSSKTLKSGNQNTVNEYENNDYGDYKPEYYFQLSYVKNEEPIEFKNEKYTLTEGRYFTKEEIEGNAKVVILSEEVRLSNNLNVGDQVGFIDWNSYYREQEAKFSAGETTVYEENQEPSESKFEVIGFYSGATEYEVDRGFMPFGLLVEFVEPEYYSDYISNIYFLLDDPLKIEGFIERNVEKMPTKYTTLTSGDNQYESLTRPLDLMEMIAEILIWVIFIAGALIIISIVTIFVRDRRFEVGLLLSSGESKFKVVSQFIFEILIVAIIAFGVATGASQASSGLVANWIVQNQLVEEETTDDMYMYYGYGSIQNEVSMEEVAEEFDVALSGEVLFNLLLISLGILVAASSIPLLIIVAYKPRKALQD